VRISLTPLPNRVANFISAIYNNMITFYWVALVKIELRHQ
jgi:hypothetical protein